MNIPRKLLIRAPRVHSVVRSGHTEFYLTGFFSLRDADGAPRLIAAFRDRDTAQLVDAFEAVVAGDPRLPAGLMYVPEAPSHLVLHIPTAGMRPQNVAPLALAQGNESFELIIEYLNRRDGETLVTVYRYIALSKA